MCYSIRLAALVILDLKEQISGTILRLWKKLNPTSNKPLKFPISYTIDSILRILYRNSNIKCLFQSNRTQITSVPCCIMGTMLFHLIRIKKLMRTYSYHSAFIPMSNIIRSNYQVRSRNNLGTSYAEAKCTTTRSKFQLTRSSLKRMLQFTEFLHLRSSW